MQTRPAPAEVQPVLFSTSSVGILSSVVAMLVASRRRPSRPCLLSPSPHFHLRTAKITQLPTRADKRSAEPHSSRIERHAARGGGAERAVGTRRVKEKQTRRMVAQATGSAAPLVSAPRTPSRHRSKDHTDASVARRDALPWPVAHLGVGSPIVDSPIWMQRGGGRTGCACPRNVGRNPYKPSKTCTCTGEPLLPTVPSLSCIEFWLRID